MKKGYFIREWLGYRLYDGGEPNVLIIVDQDGNRARFDAGDRPWEDMEDLLGLLSDDLEHDRLRWFSPRDIERLARELFATYRRYLATFLECSEGELPAVTARLADEDFEILVAAQNAAEEMAWALARRDNPEWPRAGSEEEDAVAEVFQRIGYEEGY